MAGDNGWVEFYNPTLGAVSLRGYSLTNSPSTPRLQPISPTAVVPARGFLAVDLTFVSRTDRRLSMVGLYGRPARSRTSTSRR